MTDLAKPSIDPADEGTLTGLIRHAFKKLIQGVDGMLPVKVVAFNGDRNNPRVSVQPQVSVLTTEGQRVQRAQIENLPVFQFGAGGYFFSFPIKTDDPGWIIAADRDISLYLQSGKISQPNTFRRKSFADAWFIPDIRQGYTVAAEDVDRPVWQKKDGSVKIVLADAFARVTAPRGLGVNTDPDPNTILHAASTTKASIPWPKMTQAQRNAIPNPVEGMVVWNLTTHGISVYNGTTWS